MKIEKKLEIFTQVTMMDVEKKRRLALAEIDAAFNNAVDEASRAMEKQARERIREERYKIDKIKNKKIFAASSEAKRALIELRDKRTKELFDDVLSDIRRFTASAEYENFLLTALQNTLAASPGRYTIVQLSSGDKALGERVRAVTGLTVEHSEEDFLGGFKLMTSDRRLVFDQTLLNRFEEERRGFSMMWSRNRDNM